VSSKYVRHQQRFQWHTKTSGAYVVLKPAQYFIRTRETNVDSLSTWKISFKSVEDDGDNGCGLRRGLQMTGGKAWRVATVIASFRFKVKPISTGTAAHRTSTAACDTRKVSQRISSHRTQVWTPQPGTPATMSLPAAVDFLVCSCMTFLAAISGGSWKIASIWRFAANFRNGTAQRSPAITASDPAKTSRDRRHALQGQKLQCKVPSCQWNVWNPSRCSEHALTAAYAGGLC
jgi:hypothetical protein